jgi:GntR family transcriptional regulator
MTTLDSSSALPLYAQVETILAADIASGAYPPGSRLPNETELVEKYAVSRTTIRQTIQNLIRRGLVEIRRGKGTFVLEPKITQELTELSGFVEDMHALGHRPSARLLDKRIVPSSEAVARHLALGAGTRVVRIQRVRLANGVPISFDETYLPREIGEKIMENNLETEPIFSLLEEKYDMPLIEAEYRLEAVSADAVVARALGVRTGSPIFLIERTSFCEGPRPVDYERLYYRGDQVRFVTRLARRAKTRAKGGRR